MPDLRNLVRALLDDTELTDPREIAAKVIAQLDRDQADAALHELMPAFVREVIRAHRNVATFREQSATSGRPEQTRADQIREAYGRPELRGRFYGGQDAGWQMLGDFTSAMHRIAAEYASDLARANAAAASWHKLCARTIDRAGVDRMAELPAALLDELLKAKP